MNYFDKAKIYFISSITITLFSEMYFFPFHDPFRFSLGVIAFSIILLFYYDIKELSLAAYTATAVFILRFFLYYFNGDLPLLELLRINLPGAMYYIIYAMIFYILKVRDFIEFPWKTIYFLSIADATSNIIEAIIRGALTSQLILYITIIAFFRSTITYLIYYFLKHKELSIKKVEHEDKYNQLNTIISNIQSEIFYLSKSQTDIENVMSKAYNLYEITKDNKEINYLALDVAREIHEIKKDYYRAINGFKSFFDNFNYDNSMYLKDICTIIESNFTRYVDYLGKDINISINLSDNIKIKNYYYLFTIINNLITNAVDAILDVGEINIYSESNRSNLIITISDNGSGIDKDFIEHIFSPGFTTKYDSETGKSSTGIGLSHVKYIVESLNGTVEVSSRIDTGTTFNVILPMDELRG